MEVWKDVKGFEGLYMVSNKGNVKSLNYKHTETERILSPSDDKGGYPHIGLYKDGKRFYKRINRLVCEAFKENPNNLPEVNHKDEDKHNNHIENLEWCTKEYNTNYGTRNKRISKARINNKKVSRPILQYTISGDFIKEYPSMREAERQTGFRQGNISSCCGGRIKTAYGFLWKYK